MIKPSIFYLFTLILLISCKESTRKKLQGEWHNFDYENDQVLFNDISFIGDSVKLIGRNGFTVSGVFNTEKETIQIKSNNADLNIKVNIKDIWTDSIALINNAKFHKIEQLDCIWDSYNLVNIPSSTLLSEQEKKENLALIHFYKKNGEIKIKYNGNYIGFEDLYLTHYACSVGAPVFYKTLLYLGDDILLKDLKKFYYYIEIYGSKAVWIGTKTKGFTDMFLVKDFTKILDDDLRAYFSSLGENIPPSNSEFKNIQSLLDQGRTIFEINSVSDFSQLNEFEKNKTYLAIINSNLELKDYIDFLKLLNISKANNDIIAIIR